MTQHLARDVYLSHPSWYFVPSTVKDSDGPGGGTLQGRITCKDAAHQTDPLPIEKCRRSRWRHGVLLSLDLSQIELRVAALLSGEPAMVDAYNLGWDIHARTAVTAFTEQTILRRYPDLVGKPVDTWKHNKVFDQRERYVGKRINFSGIFRGGADVMQAAVLGDIGELLPITFFEGIVRARPTVFPVLWQWQEDLIAQSKREGCITLPFIGQSRSFLGGTKYEVNEICNFPVQTTAGNTLNRLQSYITRALLTWRLPRPLLYLNVYDALYFDCPTRAHADRLLTELLPAAFTWLTTVDYWHMLQTHYGRCVPLAYDHKLIPSQEPTHG